MKEGRRGTRRRDAIQLDAYYHSKKCCEVNERERKENSKSNSMKSKRNKISMMARKKKVKDEIKRIMII